MDGLVAGAIRAADAAGASYRLHRVPGAFELTVVAEALARKGAEAIVCLGVVIKGATPHFEYVCEGVTQDRKSTRLNSSHVKISYAVFCLKKKKDRTQR